MDIPKGYFVRRCSHVKTNGTQCNSPALKLASLCFFHDRWSRTYRCMVERQMLPGEIALDLPLLEDADSIQLAIMQVTYFLSRGRLNPKTAALLLYALQTASSNLKKTTLQPQQLQDVVVDPRSLANSCIGDHAWRVEDFPESEAVILPDLSEQDLSTWEAVPNDTFWEDRKTRSAIVQSTIAEDAGSTKEAEHTEDAGATETPAIDRSGLTELTGHTVDVDTADAKPVPANPTRPQRGSAGRPLNENQRRLLSLIRNRLGIDNASQGKTGSADTDNGNSRDASAASTTPTHEKMSQEMSQEISQKTSPPGH